MKKRTLYIGVWLAAALAGTAAAQDVTVIKRAGAKSSLEWSGFRAGGAAGALFLQVLKTDLERSGWFLHSATGAGEFRVQGQAAGEDRLSAELRVLNAGTGLSVLGRTYAGGAAEVRAAAHRAADDLVKAVTGHEGFASSRIALVGNRTGRKELYICDSDGANLKQITRDNSISLYPRWSHDGTKLTYTSYLKSYPDAYLIELASGTRTRIAAYPGLNAGAVLSPDGRHFAIVLSRDGNPELYVRAVGGGALTRLTNTPRGAESSPTWSPDGSQIAYVSDQSGQPQVYVMARNGGAGRRLTVRGGQNVAPNWGPGGKIVCSTLVGGGKYSLSVVDPASGEMTTFAFNDGADYEDPSWARNGRHVACSRKVAHVSSICLVDTMGGEKLVLLTGNGDWFSPAWSK